jgi:Arc/MetJ-type ribon-helix-helix transcriptional regulator
MPGQDSGFRGVSLKNGLVDEVEKFVKEHHEYKNTADFIHEAVRVRMEELRREPANKKPLPRFEHFNMGANGVRITDRKIGLIADIYFKPQGIFCDLDKTDTCEHIDFALTVPEIRDIIRKHKKEGWEKLPDV